MAVRTHYVEQYPPRTISKDILRELVIAFEQFKPGLPTGSRKIKAQAISHGRITNLEGPESWKVVDPHVLDELEHVQVELLLVASTPSQSCEIHVEFRQTHVGLSVSDIETGWGKAVFEEGKHVLRSFGVSAEGWRHAVRRLYGCIDVTQNALMVLGSIFFSAWLKAMQIAYLYAAVGLFVAGVVPTLQRLLAVACPPKRISLMGASSPKGNKFPWVEAGVVLTFLAAVLSLLKEGASFFTGN